MKNTDSNLPPPHLLEALCRHGRQPYHHRRFTRDELFGVGLADIVERGTADDILEAVRARYWHYKETPEGCIHRQLTPDAELEAYYLIVAADRKKAGRSAKDIARMFVEKEAATWARIERVVAARKAAGIDTAQLERIIAIRKKRAG